MIKMYSGCARNPKDVERAVALAAKTFRSNEKEDGAINVTRLLLSPLGVIAEQDVVILSNAADEIIGACFLFDRYFYRGRKKLKGTFLTSICIAESSRGKGYSDILMNCAITEVKQRGATFAILIARRAVDHFYNKFHFWGLSQYSKIHIQLSDTSASNREFTFSPVTMSDLTVVNTLYESIYSGMYGSCERSLEYWKHVMWKADNQGCNFFAYKIKNRISGYVMFSGSEIFELASAQNVSCFDLIHDLGQQSSLMDVTLHCSDDHPVLRELEGVDFSLTKRQCNYGGHMVRIINETALLSELAEEAQDTIASLGMKNYIEKQGDALIELQNGKVGITLAGSPHEYENTCFLMGAGSLSMISRRPAIYNSRSFNVPLFDQC